MVEIQPRFIHTERHNTLMKKILLGLVAAAAIAAPLVVAGTASAAPAPATKATGNVTWVVTTVDGTFNGTVRFDANSKTGGTLDYTNSFGSYLHGVVTPDSVVKTGNTVTFDGTFTDASANYLQGGNVFHAVVTDVSTSGSHGDEIAVFVNERAYNVHADVTSGNLTVF